MTKITKTECTSNLKNVIDALYVLNGKWKLPIVLSLVNAPKRFNEIMKDVEGISPKILAQELKHLEQNELVVRNVYDTIPVSIVYEASLYSETLKDVLKTLSEWGASHRKKITENKNSLENKLFTSPLLSKVEVCWMV